MFQKIARFSYVSRCGKQASSYRRSACTLRITRCVLPPAMSAQASIARLLSDLDISCVFCACFDTLCMSCNVARYMGDSNNRCNEPASATSCVAKVRRRTPPSICLRHTGNTSRCLVASHRARIPDTSEAAGCDAATYSG